MVDFPGRPKIAYGDVAALAEITRPIITSWYAGHIYIFDPAQNDTSGTNIETGTFNVTIHPYWNGPARIQPMRTNLDSKQTTNDTTTRVVEFQCGFAKDGTLPDVRPGHQIVVTDGGNNPLLTLAQYVISGSLNSSQAWNHTIWAETNLEARPFYTIPGL